MADLYCFGPAGGGTVDFRRWPEDLPATTRVVPVRLPGRETLMSTPAHRSMRTLVPWVLDAHPFTGDFAFYGHSMGAWVAFEVAHGLRAAGRPVPTRLTVAARRAPHLPPSLPPLSPLSDDAFVAAIQDRYNAIPERLLAQPRILKLFLPTLRADFQVIDDYTCDDRPPLDLPVVAIRGLSDPTVSRSELAAWREHTTADFQLRQVPGGHFFHRDGPPWL